MALYMDVHTIPGGATADDVARAHMADLQTQAKYDVRYLRYWVNEPAGKHRQAHGLVADDVFLVQEGS